MAIDDENGMDIDALADMASTLPQTEPQYRSNVLKPNGNPNHSVVYDEYSAASGGMFTMPLNTADKRILAGEVVAEYCERHRPVIQEAIAALKSIRSIGGLFNKTNTIVGFLEEAGQASAQNDGFSRLVRRRAGANRMSPVKDGVDNKTLVEEMYAAVTELKVALIPVLIAEYSKPPVAKEGAPPAEISSFAKENITRLQSALEALQKPEIEHFLIGLRTMETHIDAINRMPEKMRLHDMRKEVKKLAGPATAVQAITDARTEQTIAEQIARQ